MQERNARKKRIGGIVEGRIRVEGIGRIERIEREAMTVKLQVDRFKCAACGACVTVCARDALILWGAWLEINHELCNACSSCVNVCPVGALKLDKA